MSSRKVSSVISRSSLTYLEEDLIGSGAFGEVFKTLHNDWGCQVAFKKLDVRHIGDSKNAHQKLTKELMYEAEIHNQLRHPHIVSMLGVVFERDNYGIVLEYVTCGSLSDFIFNLTETSEMMCVPWVLKTQLSYEICSGMSYLHSCSIIHCDLKLQNILVAENISAKISDFGLSKWKDYSRSHTRAGVTQGTPSHISPEQWTPDPPRPDDKSDVYSFSILLWELLTEKEAYQGRKDRIRQLVMCGERLSLTSIPADVPNIMRSLITACWHQQPEKRPSFSELVVVLRPLISEKAREQIKEAKSVVLSTYHNYCNNRTESNREESLHCQKISRVHRTLCENIRRTDQILSRLLELRAVTLQERELIRSQTNDYQWVSHLLDVLSVKPDFAYRLFLEALQSTNQHHLHNLLECRDYVFNVDHRSILVDNFTYLQTNIAISGTMLLDTLIETGVLDTQEVEKIRSKNTDHERINQLLHFILRTSREQYEQFLQSLDQTNHEHVYIKLKGSRSDFKLSENGHDFTDNSIMTIMENASQTTVHDISARTSPLLENQIEAIPEQSSVLSISSTTEADSPAPYYTQLLTYDELDGSRNVTTQAERQSYRMASLSNLFKTAASIFSPLASRGAEKWSTKRRKLFNLNPFLDNPKLLHVIPKDGCILGVTVLGSELFVIRDTAARGEVAVYDTKSFTVTRDLLIPGAESLWAIASCSKMNCLYISDDGHKIIYRFDLTLNKVTNNWSVGGRCYGLSITKSYSVLVTSFDAKRIKEYGSNGAFLRQIILDESIERPYHCVQLSNDCFVVSHGGWGTEESRLCVVDASGKILHSYGGPPGSSSGQMHGPHLIAVDGFGNVMVADCGNDRVELLSPTLRHVGYVHIPGLEFNGPHTLHVDIENHRLYIGEYDGGRIFVLEAGT